MTNIEVTNENLCSYRVSRDFEITIGDVEININKWVYEDDLEIDNDWSFVDSEDKKRYEELSEDDQEAFNDFIIELKV